MEHFSRPVNAGASKESEASKDKTPSRSAPSITLPKGGGAIRGMSEKFAANPVTGTGSLTVPIYTSPGRSGFGPQLSLSYDSGAGNGAFGFGWSLSLPSITRKTDKGLPRYLDTEESDEFILSGAEDLVPSEAAFSRVVDNKNYDIQRYRPRIEGLFARIERWTNEVDPADTFWRSISKDNITTWYGKDDNSRIADPANSARIFSWLICESYDDKGNVIVYQYKKEDSTKVDLSQAHEKNRTDSSRSANRYLKFIRYGNHAPYYPKLLDTEPWPTPPGNDKWYFEVVFDYGEHNADTPKPNDAGQWDCRPDSFSSYRAGFEIRTYRLCQRVLMFHHFPNEQGVGKDCLVRSTDFTYAYEQEEKDPRNPIHSVLKSVTQSGYKRKGEDGYLKKSLPSLDFEYTKAIIHDDVHAVDPESLENLPYGLDGARYQWVDLDGEGLSGILTEQAEGWFYKCNLSPINSKKENGQKWVEPKFGPIELVAEKPSLAAISGGRQQLLDLAGDGQLDLVELEGPSPGFYERTHDERWESFRTFEALPNLDWANPNLKFVDLTGDGHADILISEDEAFVWHASLAEAGFAPAQRVQQLFDEESGPRLVFSDGTQSIYLSDMSGDGLTDLVRIRNGEVCYWPNHGYGRFGAKVTMDNAPWFDNPEQFDQRRIRLADTDGSGVTDILYLGRDGIQMYFNQSGNGWSESTNLTDVPPTDNVKNITVVDLLGNGTACLVWSSPLAGDARQPMRYLDLMGGQKPYLLHKVVNNLGAETIVHYAPSTKFYVEDKRKEKPWITKIPFPVHVVEYVETLDHISKNRFITRYAYHHGYYDGIEREFRGFGMVEQWDTEHFTALVPIGGEGWGEGEATNWEKASHVPPVRTKTWFHTGAYLEGGRISKHFEEEYYNEGDPSRGETGLSEEQRQALLFEDTVLPESELTPDEIHEACRALKGSILRQEIYALDGTEEEDRPYSVSERNYTIKLLQARGKNPHAVFFTYSRETIDFHYERKLHDVDVGGKKLKIGDPRVSHTMTLAVDNYGNVLRSIAIGYRRRNFPDVKELEQKDIHITLMANRFANCADKKDWYRVGLPVETRTFEIVKPPEPKLIGPVVEPFRFKEMQELIEGRKAAVPPEPGLFPSDKTEPEDTELWPYEKWDWRRNLANSPAETRLRLIEHVRTLYYKDNLSGPLPLNEAGSRGLLYETYNLAFTPDLLKKIYVRRCGAVEEELLPVADWNKVLSDDGGYLTSDDYTALNWAADGCWWDPSGQTFYSLVPKEPAPPKPPAPLPQDVNYAEDHFFLPRGTRDPFGELTRLDYDSYDLLLTKSEDPLENTIVAENDYRVLQPRLVTDPNHNRTEVVFDAHGMVVGTAVMGKENEPDGKAKGDSLAGFKPDITEAELAAFMTKPREPAANPSESMATQIVHILLGKATTRIVYDLDRYKNSGEPPFAATIARETHVSDLPAGQESKLQVSFSYSDGFGREIQKKIRAESGQLSEGGPTINPRWVGSGWTIFNNKGKPVRQYEPFFDDTHAFKFGHTVGVSPILFYDPLERVIAMLHPNHTFEKVVFDPWQQTTYDVNDTVSAHNKQTGDPRTDPDIAGYVSEYFKTQPNDWNSWYADRINKPVGNPERDAAQKAANHADTSTLAYFDTLGRTFQTIADNGKDANGKAQHYRTRTELDIESNQHAVIDARDRVVMRYDYDMLGNRIHQASMDAGERWMLNDVTGKPIRAWDSRGHNFTTEYDALRRPLNQFVRGTDPNRSDPRILNQDILFEKTVYGEKQLNDTDLNLRTRVYKQYDGAGLATNQEYDFKGNLLSSTRQLAKNYKETPDWSQHPALEQETFTSSNTYDALNRLVTQTTPDKSVIRHTYNEANLLNAVQANLHGAEIATKFVTNIDYNAKGQRTLIAYENGAITEYTYDEKTFRLIHIETRHGTKCLQDLFYTYDPAGNITHIRDDTQQTIYFDCQVVEPHNDYIYDAIYRLIEAKGREHKGQVGQPQYSTYNDYARINQAHPHDGQAMRKYTQTYQYDFVGNIEQVSHSANGVGIWTRTYTYDENSLIEQSKKNNRLSYTAVNGTPEQPYSHDAHGNMNKMPHLSLMQWDFQDQLSATSKQVVNNGTPDTTHYVYDANGQRVRKVTEGQNGTSKDERIYLGGFEIYREYKANGDVPKVNLERETLHIMDDKQRIALVETRTLDTTGKDQGSPQLIRYQFGNHLGSASLELNDQAIIISYEEYYPYGSTSYQGVNKALKAAAKRYRYTGKERDEESGLYYHGARYYAPWLARWINCDPAGYVDGVNLYAYVTNNPAIKVDMFGFKKTEPGKTVVYPQPPEKVTFTSTTKPETLLISPLGTEAPISTMTIPEVKVKFPLGPEDPLLPEKISQMSPEELENYQATQQMSAEEYAAYFFANYRKMREQFPNQVSEGPTHDKARSLIQQYLKSSGGDPWLAWQKAALQRVKTDFYDMASTRAEHFLLRYAMAYEKLYGMIAELKNFDKYYHPIRKAWCQTGHCKDDPLLLDWEKKGLELGEQASFSSIKTGLNVASEMEREKKAVLFMLKTTNSAIEILRNRRRTEQGRIQELITFTLIRDQLESRAQLRRWVE